jgi:hyperosmotically inducible protein
MSRWRGVLAAGILGILAAGCRPAAETDVEARSPEAVTAPEVQPALEEAVRGNLQETQGLDASRVTVEVVDGLAVLSGVVPSDDARRRVEEITRRTSGIVEVRNRLIVGQVQEAPAAGGAGATGNAPANAPGTQGAAPGADSLENRVLQGIREQTTVRTQNLRVSAQGGTVTLSGTVPSETDRAAAERAARDVQGVQNVNNQLTVR